MTDDEFFALSQEYADSPDLGDDIAGEFKLMSLPCFTALLTRRIDGTTGGYTEGMWVHGYPNIASIVITHPRVRLCSGVEFPGVIRTIPLSPKNLRNAETFRAACEAATAVYEGNGWTRRPHTIQGS